MCMHVCVCVAEDSLTISRCPASAVLTLNNLIALSKEHSAEFNFHHYILLYMIKKEKGG